MNIKPRELHVLQGTFRGDRHGQAPDAPSQGAARPIKPRGLRKRESEIWDEYVERAPWIHVSDSHAFACWCGLAAELEKGIGKMIAARISQFRSLSSELGLHPVGRARMAVRPQKPDAAAPKRPKSSAYFPT